MLFRSPAGTAGPSTPTVRNLTFERIVCASGDSYAIEILGLPEMPATNMAFSGIEASTAKGINICDAKGLTFTNCAISAAAAPLVSVNDGEDITIDGATFGPAGAGTVRVEGSKSQNITIRKSNLRNPETDVVLGPGAQAGAVRFAQ